MEITVIDASDHVGWLAAATRLGEVYMSDVQSMVDNVLQRAGNNLISRLNILDHGNPNGIQIGTDWVSNQTLGNFSQTLGRLNGHFTADGFVHLQHCNIGQNHPLLTSLAGIFGVAVFAGTGAHNPIYRFNLGEYVRCEPLGQCREGVPRPGSTPPGPGPWANPNKVCCFPAGTVVQTPAGELPIELIRANHYVYSLDPVTGRTLRRRVTKMDEHAGEFALRRIGFSSGLSVGVTDGHRFADVRAGWTSSERLCRDTAITTLQGTPDGIAGIQMSPDRVSRVYNLRVEAAGNYFVGRQGLLVRDC